MAVAQALLDRLELAGINCKDFREPLQQACQDSSSASVLQWLARKLDGNLLSNNQALLLSALRTEAGDCQNQVSTSEATVKQDLIAAVKQELDSQSLLDVCLSEEEVQQSIAIQEATLLQLQAKLKSLQALGSAITKQSSEHLQPVAEYHEKRTDARLSGTAKRLAGQQKACNTLLHDTQQTASDLRAIFTQHSSTWLLSLADLQNLHQQDTQYQIETDRLYKKQFHNGSAASIHEQHTSSQWLHNHDPLQTDSLYNMLRGSDSQAYEEHVQELDRLRWIHEASQMQYITTLAWQAKQEAMLDSIRLTIHRASSLQEPTLMQAELSQLTAELKKLTARKQQLLSDQLPALCSQVAALQETQVLQQDYNAKLVRQQYYINKKQGFIDLLIDQQARHHLLQLAREDEVKQLQATQQELQLLHELLSDVRVASQQRMSNYAQRELQPVIEPQLVVHDSDSFLQTLDRLLPETAEGGGGDRDKAKLYLTFEQLSQKLAALSEQDAAAAIRQQAQRMQTGAAASMQAAFAQLHPLVFPNKDKMDAQMTAPELEQIMQSAQAASIDLTATVNKVAQQQQTYQNILHQQQKQLSAERGVFSMFHMQPERLGQILSG